MRTVVFAIGLTCWLGLPINLWGQSAKPLKDAPLEYADIGRRSAIEGTLRVRAQLDRDGKVVDVTFHSGFGFPFFPEVKNSVKKWQFLPCSGISNKCQVDLEFIFVLKQGICTADVCPTVVVYEAPNHFRVTAQRKPAIVD